MNKTDKKKKPTIIRTSKHSLKFCNEQKLQDISTLVDDYRCFVQQIIDYIWLNGYKDFSIKKNLDLPDSLMDSDFLNQFKWDYTGRLKQCAGKQVLSMISAATETRRRQLFKLKELQKEGYKVTHLQRKIDSHPLIKPRAHNINLELDSRFVDFEFDEQKEFLCFIRIKQFKKNGSIKIPIKSTETYEKWTEFEDENKKKKNPDEEPEKIFKIQKSVRLSKKNINLYFKAELPEKKEEGIKVGCDQGIIDLVTFTDGQKVPKYQNRYTLRDILQIMSRKQPGSKAFKRAQEFRLNALNWSLNQLNYSNIKELRVEKLYKVRYNKYTEVPNEFRSQRCSMCSWVRKSNRKGKTFCCNKCGYAADADENAASNQLIDLYKVPYWVRLKKINRQGFYWKSDGIYSESQEQIVPGTERG